MPACPTGDENTGTVTRDVLGLHPLTTTSHTREIPKYNLNFSNLLVDLFEFEMIFKKALGPIQPHCIK
jgi:hypothetical protein